MTVSVILKSRQIVPDAFTLNPSSRKFSPARRSNSFVRILKEELIRAEVLPEDFDLPAHLEYTGMQPGDMEVTFADASALERDYGYKAHTDLRTGLGRFARWYREYTTGK